MDKVRSSATLDEGTAAPVQLRFDALAACTWPVIIFGAQATVLFANCPARELKTAIDGNEAPDLVALVIHALSSNVCVGDTVMLITNRGRRYYDVVLTPAHGVQVLMTARDVTMERSLRSALVESRQRYKDLVDVSSDFAWEVGPDGRFAFVSPKGALGYAADELVGLLPTDITIEIAGSNMLSPFHPVEPVEDVEIWMRDAYGRHACVLASSAPLLGSTNEWRGARGVCRDVTVDRARDTALSRANNRERLLTYIVRTIRDVVDPADMLTAAAQATARSLTASGCMIFRRDEAGHFIRAAEWGDCNDPDPILESLASADHHERHTDGWRILASVSRYRQAINGAVLMWREDSRMDWNDDDRLLLDDVANQIGIANEQILNHDRILLMSRSDALTGLFNRRAFFEALQGRANRMGHEQAGGGALIYIDLDNFKLVNDVHGHAVGDEALLALRELLVHSTRPTDLLARLGGDEFAIWLDGATEEVATGRASALLDSAKALGRFAGSPDKPLQMSIGLALFDVRSGESIEALVTRADEAMYAAKRSGKAGWSLAPAAAPAAPAED